MGSTNRYLVPRPQKEPTAEQVRAAMTVGEPYTTGDLTTQFEDVSRWTIQRRLELLHDDGAIHKKTHAENRVSWWVEPA